MTETQHADGRGGAIAQRLENLQLVSDAALSYLTPDDLVRELVKRIVTIFDADTAAILLLQEDGETLVAQATHGLEDGFRLTVGAGFAGRIAADRKPITIEDVGPGDVVNPAFLERGVRSLLGVPMVVEQRLIGVVHVGALEHRSFTPEDVDLLEQAASRAALAIDHDRLLEQHRLVNSVQRSLLPDRLPGIPGVRFAARYIPALSAAEVGGDWYDVIRRSDGTVGLAIGDVVGHGIDAATMMGQLRNALRAYALEVEDASATLQKLSRFALELDGSPMATCMYGVLDASTGELGFASAGHPPPLVIDPGSGAQFSTGAAMPPLGSAYATGEDATVALEEGQTALFYTDGLIERRGEGIKAGQARLREAVTRTDPDQVCTEVVAELLGPDAAAQDDVALLAVHFESLDDSFEHELGARPVELTFLRRFLTRWLARAGASERETERFNLACSEAAANAIEHAYGPGAATFRARGSVANGEVEIEIRDFGTWRPPRGEERGRGLALMKAMVDKVVVRPAGDGTSVTLCHRLQNADA